MFLDKTSHFQVLFVILIDNIKVDEFLICISNIFTAFYASSIRNFSLL